MDAVDAALVRFEQDQTQVLACLSQPIAERLRRTLRTLTANSPLGEVVRLDQCLGKVFAAAVEQLLEQGAVSRREVAAIGCHGQTVLHLPRGAVASSVQIADPNVLAWRTQITTVADFRRMDMAAGGEGAPLTPAFHAWQFQRPGRERAVLNIGGMANLTLLPGAENGTVIGFDTGPGNVLLDDWSMRWRNLPMDRNGDWAASGQCDERLLEVLLQDAYFSRAPPKSTGREYFHLGWLEQALQSLPAPARAQDVQASLLQLSVRSVCRALRRHAPDCRELLVCGGGVHNRALMQALMEHMPAYKIDSTSAQGIHPDYVEAISFAWLARQRLALRTLDLRSVTGATGNTVLGGIYAPPPGTRSS